MAITRTKNFTPYGNYTVAASTTSANQVITQPASGEVANDLQISNSTAGVAFITYGTSAQTATSAGFAVMPGAIEVISMGNLPITNIGVILSAGSGSVYLSNGLGA